MRWIRSWRKITTIFIYTIYKKVLENNLVSCNCKGNIALDIDVNTHTHTQRHTVFTWTEDGSTEPLCNLLLRKSESENREPFWLGAFVSTFLDLNKDKNWGRKRICGEKSNQRTKSKIEKRFLSPKLYPLEARKRKVEVIKRCPADLSGQFFEFISFWRICVPFSFLFWVFFWAVRSNFATEIGAKFQINWN